MAKQQIVIIHGGDTYATYEAYLQELKNFTITSLDFFRSGGWKRGMQEALGEAYDVIAPQMPNKANAKYAEWEIWFEKLIPLLEDGVVCIGHSLGGIFLAKYLSTHAFPRDIRAVFLIAAPYDLDPRGSLEAFVITEPLTQLQKMRGNVFLYHSKDDPVVQFGELAKYHAALPDATVCVFEDRGHFNQQEFSEIVEDIRNLA